MFFFAAAWKWQVFRPFMSKFSACYMLSENVLYW